MKKKLALALAAVMMIGLFAGCGGNKTASSGSAAGSQASSGSAAQAEELNVGVFYYDFSDVYISSVRASMDEQLTAMGVKFTN